MWDETVLPRIQEIKFQNTCFDLIRLDQIESLASGNKYYKLKYYLQSAYQNNRQTIVSKGGMFSNHLHALAIACHALNIPCICMIGTFKDDDQNPTLRDIKALGATCHMISPEEFRSFDETSSLSMFPDALFIPEGGSGLPGIKGTREILDGVDQRKYSHIFVPVGSFGTAAGVLDSVVADTTVHLVPAWKGCTMGWIKEQLNKYDLHPKCKIRLHDQFHFGGFGKYNDDLIRFMESFYVGTNVVLEPVYSAKMMFALFNVITNGIIPDSENILAIHTGGQQGLRGYLYRFPHDWEMYDQLINCKPTTNYTS